MLILSKYETQFAAEYNRKLTVIVPHLYGLPNVHKPDIPTVLLSSDFKSLVRSLGR